MLYRGAEKKATMRRRWRSSSSSSSSGTPLPSSSSSSFSSTGSSSTTTEPEGCPYCHLSEDSSDSSCCSRRRSPRCYLRRKRRELQLQRFRTRDWLKPEFHIEPEVVRKANPAVDDELPEGAPIVFRRLSEEEFVSALSIHEAAAKGDLHIVKLLTRKEPKRMETVDERGWTPIHLAAANGHAHVVQYLAAEGAHLAALDPSSYTALHLAAMNGHLQCLEVLLSAGVDVDSITAEGFTALHLAVMNSHLECIALLLESGASLEKKDSLGRGVKDMLEEYDLNDVATLLRRLLTS